MCISNGCRGYITNQLVTYEVIAITVAYGKSACMSIIIDSLEVYTYVQS